MSLLALDIGGANLKAADGRGFAVSRYFPLWQSPERLPQALAELLAKSPAAEQLVVTMTGELADCFATKAEGVRSIVSAVEQVAGPRKVSIYGADGSFMPPALAAQRPLLAAASNWHALARFAGRYAETATALLIDIGSTTCDNIPLLDGRPRTRGQTDPERLESGELVYTGVERSPVCALVQSIPWREARCRVAQELFATTKDAYLILGELPEDSADCHTADGRPATRAAAIQRLARTICADGSMFDAADARRAAVEIADAQTEMIAIAAGEVIGRLDSPPGTVILSGQGEFLAKRVQTRIAPGAVTVSLGEKLGATVTRAAPAHALAVLFREEFFASEHRD
jgi:probable H4MPT-linked C1 transfer pathway protein